MSLLKRITIMALLLILTACATQPVAAPEAAGEAAPAQDEAASAAAEAETSEEGVSVDTVEETTQEEVASGQYQEAPMLAEMVAAGDLPAVDERLPVNPMVLTPVEKVGTYGGELKWVHPTPSLGAYEFQFLRGPLSLERRCLGHRAEPGGVA
jgi:hypothetical protein